MLSGEGKNTVDVAPANQSSSEVLAPGDLANQDILVLDDPSCPDIAAPGDQVNQDKVVPDGSVLEDVQNNMKMQDVISDLKKRVSI